MRTRFTAPSVRRNSPASARLRGRRPDEFHEGPPWGENLSARGATFGRQQATASIGSLITLPLVRRTRPSRSVWSVPVRPYSGEYGTTKPLDWEACSPVGSVWVAVRVYTPSLWTGTVAS